MVLREAIAMIIQGKRERIIFTQQECKV